MGVKQGDLSRGRRETGRSQSIRSSEEVPKRGWSEGNAGRWMMTGRTEEAQPAPVSETAKPAGEIRARWAWVEPEVWTERMLTALEAGVRGGKWHSLIDKVYAVGNLLRGYQRVAANGGAAGVDHQTIEMFGQRLEENVGKLSASLEDGSYRPQAVRRTWIEKLGSKDKRPLGIPTVRDRVVQTAVRQVMEPIFERDFAEHSYGFRPGRGCKEALRRVDHLLKGGYHWVVDADLKGYFDTIPRQRLLEQVGEKIADGRVLALVDAFLQQRIMEGMKTWTPMGGTPQGAVISPLLSNIYLDPLDQGMAEQGFEMVRYADDFVILCRSEAEAKEALERVKEWTEQAGLTLHPEKTRIVEATQAGGFDFLGYTFAQGQKRPRRKSLKKFKDTIRAKTRRNHGESLKRVIEDLNRTLRGWFGYFQHSHKDTFPTLDSWIRMRLRSILRRRQKQRGRGRGRDHQRWPNAYFAQHGLFSLATAHVLVCQSLAR
jgi:RNA-directed DNA polymerase